MNQLHQGPHGARSRIVVFGGGKGGVGRSTLASEAARSLARHGQRVLCVDAAPHAPSLFSFLAAPEPDSIPRDQAELGERGVHLAEFIEQTPVRHVWLASLAGARRSPYARAHLAPEALLAQLHELDFEYVLIDLPPGLDPLGVALFILADLPVLVCTPEPAAVRVTTQFLRAALLRALWYAEGADQIEREALERLAYERPIAAALDEIERAEGPGARSIVESAGRALESYLIVNKTREGAERDLGWVLAHAWGTELGAFPRFLGPVDYEDRRWFYNRRNAGQSTSRGDEALSHDIESIARSIAEIDAFDRDHPRPVPGPDSGAPPAALIGLASNTAPNLVRQHCRRIWEGYRREATVGLALSAPSARAEMAERVEALYRRAAAETDEPTRPAPPSPAHPPPPDRPSPPPSPPFAPPHPSEEPDAGSEAGAVLSALRRERGVSLQDLSLRTHIGLKFLIAIEQADARTLPRPVYLRGYLREIARVFQVDADALIERYFALLGD